MSSVSRALVVDTSAQRAKSLQDLLSAAGHDVSCALGVQEAVAALGRDSVDVVIVAARDAADVVPLIEPCDDASVIVLLDGGSEDAVRAAGSGVHSIVSASASPNLLLVSVDRAIRDTNARRELALLRARASDETAQALVGRSSAMTQLRELLGHAAASHRMVQITGEAGVGKDLAARLVHDLSERASRPFVRVRCTDADMEALEHELFGSAATNSRMGRKGLLEAARGGTVVLDGCASLTHGLRARVAQAIVHRTAPRVGDDALVRVDVRVVLTARESTRSMQRHTGADVAFEGVSVIPIYIPPLRERRSDIPLLVQHFRARLQREQGLVARALSADAVMSLLAQEWTGNVRELEHWVELDALRSVDARHTITPHGSVSGSGLAIPLDASWTLDQLEQKYILHVLEQEDGNQSRAAERLGIDRRTLYRKLKEYREPNRRAS